MEQEQSKKRKIAVGLDIGTTKVCALVIEENTDDTYNILSCAVTENRGVHRGVIVNIEKTVEAIKTVISTAEQQSGIKIKDVVVGLAGDHVEALTDVSTITISNQNNIITKADVDRVISDLSKSKIAAGRRIIHIVPYEYIVDGQDGIHDPIGMCGVKLQANVHIVSGLETALKNISVCVEEKVGLNIKKIMLEPIASSQALLSDEEEEIGVGLIDIGGGTTDLTIFENNVLRYTTVIGIGGNNITEDIRRTVLTTAIEAERIKCTYGHTYLPSLMKDDNFQIGGAGSIKPKDMKKSDLCRIIQPRLMELFQMCKHEIEVTAGYGGKLGAGLVITGGSALFEGTEELATEIFNCPVRIGYPLGIKYKGLSDYIENPKYSTVVGLALEALKFNDKCEIEYLDEKSSNDVDADENDGEDYDEEEENSDGKKKKEPKEKKEKRSLKELGKDFYNMLKKF